MSRFLKSSYVWATRLLLVSVPDAVSELYRSGSISKRRVTNKDLFLERRLDQQDYLPFGREPLRGSAVLENRTRLRRIYECDESPLSRFGIQYSRAFTRR